MFGWAAEARGTEALTAQFRFRKDHPISRRLASLYRAIEANTGGKVKIEDFWAEELVRPEEELDALARGALDILVGAGGYYSGKIAVADITMMPGSFKRPVDRTKVFYDKKVGTVKVRHHDRRRIHLHDWPRAAGTQRYQGG